MKILHVIISLEPGGAELMLERLVREQRRSQSVEPIVVSLMEPGALERSLKKEGIEVLSMGMTGIGNVVATVWRLQRLIKKTRPDIVQTWMYHADLLGGIAARLAGARNVVWGVRNTDLFHGRGVSRSLNLIMRLCASLSSTLPRAIVCVAEAARLSHARFGYATDRMLVIPNGFVPRPGTTPQARDEARRALGLSEPALIIGSVGRFNAYKDQRNFVSAMGIVASRLEAARILMIGRNIDSSNLELNEWIAETGFAERFVLLGERSDIERCFAAMDIFCLHSKSEGFPNVLAEAMLAGIPAVATDVGDARLLSGGCVGLVEPENSAALADAIVGLLQVPEEKRAAGAREGRQRILEHYSLEAISERYFDLYRHLAGSRPEPVE